MGNERKVLKLHGKGTSGPLKKTAAQFIVMTFGSGLFFLLKIGCLYLTEQIGLASWLSYLTITVALTVVAWAYHSKATFATALSVDTAWRFTHATLGLMLLDYLGFIALTYGGGVYPVVSAILVSGIVFGIRFLTYSRYVFRGSEVATERRLKASNIVLGIALLIGLINYALAVDSGVPQQDGKQNYCSAANLYVFGVFSQDCDTTPSARPEPSMKREPGTPALVALTFVLIGSHGDVRLCATESSEWCNALRIHQRTLLLIPFMALILLVYFCGYEVTANRYLASAAALCAAFGTGLVSSSVTFLTEPLAAVLVVVVAWMLFRIVCVRGRVLSSVVCGLALGALALTKAVYFYFIPVLGLIALCTLMFRPKRRASASALVAVVIAILVSGLWIYRNYQSFGDPAVAGRAGTVMSIRAAYNTMTWSQYWSGYLVATPKLGPKLAKLFALNPDEIAAFDRENPDGFYRRGKYSGARDETRKRQRALAEFVERWPMEIALIPLTIYWSSFLPVNIEVSRATRDSGLARSFWRVSRVLALIVALGAMPAFLLNVFIDIWRLNTARLAFHLPALYSVGIHSVMTHYIPRYNLPLFGVFSIELCMAAYFLWIVFNDRKSNAQPIPRGGPN